MRQDAHLEMRGATGTPIGFSRWSPLAIGAAALLTLYAPVVASMAVEWATFPSLSHGFAVPFISAYLIWRRWPSITAEAPGSSTAGLGLLCVGLGILLLGTLGGESFLSRLSLPIALLGLALFLAGPRVTRRLWPAIAYLVFMVPLPYLTLKAALYQSRLFEAGVTARALRWLGVPVIQQGVMLQLPTVTLEVADDCSSLRVVAALLALGVAYALVSPRATWIRVALILSVAPLGVASSLIRLVLTGLGVYLLGPITLSSVFHRFSGTIVFLATVVLLVVLDRILERVARSRQP